ncbi:MAG: hypothetical protein WAZ98_09955 [Cyclobacteriaceae bacterium]
MRALLLLFLLFVSLRGVGQSTSQQVIDSLKQRLESAQDTTRVDILIRLARLNYNIDMKESLSLGEEALELATSLNYIRA